MKLLAIRAAVIWTLAIALSAGFSQAPKPALALVPSGPYKVSYVIAYEPLFGFGLPYTGWLQLTVNHGILNGTYRGMSVQGNDPFVNRSTPVTGGSSQGAIHFRIGSGSSALSFNGTMSGDYFSGSATWRGKLYRLMGKIGKPAGH